MTRTEFASRELLSRITSGEWGPGSMLPSEFKLAEELGVSQGTARKAIGMLETRGIVERQQGRGTFVAKTTPEKALFKFFRVRHADGSPALPTLQSELVTRRAPNQLEKARFGSNGELFEIARQRDISGGGHVSEVLMVPSALFPGLDARSPLPNALYALFEKDYGLSIENSAERLWTEIEDNVAVLVVQREATDISGRCIELRLSRYRLGPGMSYAG